MQKGAAKPYEPNVCRIDSDRIQDELLACRWLVKLGSPNYTIKRCVFDGHERDVVVTYRNRFWGEIRRVG